MIESAEYKPGPDLTFGQFMAVYEQDRQIRQDQIRELVDHDPAPADYDAAEELVFESLMDIRTAYQRTAKGLVTIQPKILDKNVGVIIDTANPDLFSLFRQAAQAITKKYGGFFQTGSHESSGYAFWELWNPPQSAVELFAIVDGIYEEMKAIEKMRQNTDWYLHASERTRSE